MNNFFKQFFATFKDLLKHPKKLIPTFILIGIWLVFPLMSLFGANIPVLRFLYGLTYANGGMYGGFFGALGGIVGKAVFAAFVNAIVIGISEKKKLFSTEGLKGVLKFSAAGGLAAAAPFIAAGGVGVLVYWFFNITSSIQNCAIGLVGAVSALAAAGGKKGLLFSLGFGILNKLSKGKAPSEAAVRRALTGFSMGFALGVALTFIRFAPVLVIAGVLLVVAGIVAGNMAKKTKKAVAAAILALMLIPPMFAGTCLNVSAAEYCSPNEIPELRDKISSGSGTVGSASTVASLIDGAQIGYGRTASSFFRKTLEDEMYGCPLGEESIGSNNLSTAKVEKGGEAQSLTVEGLAGCYTNGKKGDMLDFSENLYNVSYRYTVELTNIRFDGNRIKADASGTETLDYGLTTGDGQYTNGSLTNNVSGTDISGKWYTDDGMLFVLLDIPGDASNLCLYLEVSRVLPAGGAAAGTSDGDELSESVSVADTLGIGVTEDDEGYVKYRGHLIFEKDHVNKYGQHFPVMMDYNRDGVIDFTDLEIQRELVHNPDYLGLPESSGIAVVIAIITGIGGGLAGAAGAVIGAAAGTAGSALAEATAEAAGEVVEEIAAGAADGADFGDLSRYISRDADGDLNVTDPATGEKRLYKANGDGTYTNPLTGATYTEDELAESIGSRYENAELISQDQAVAEAAVSQQREDNQKLSEGAAEYSAQKAKAEEELNRELYMDKLEIKYGIAEGDTDALKEAIGERQEQAESDSQYYTDRVKMYDNAIKAAEVTQTAADIGVDVLATVTGPAGQNLKKAYTVGKNMATRLSEAACSDDPNKQSLSAAFAMAGFDSIADIAQDSLGGMGYQFSSNVGSEMFKGGMQNLYDGKDFFDGWEQNAAQGAAKGVIDKIGGAIQTNQQNITKEMLHKDMAQIGHAVANGKVSKAGERALRDMRLLTYVNNIHAEQAVETATTAVGDVAKLVVDSVSDSLGGQD